MTSPTQDNVDADASLLADALRRIGLAVEFVPRSETQTCDLRVSDAREAYLVEVKAFLASRLVQNPGSGFFVRWRSAIDTVRDRITKATRQTRASATGPRNELRLAACIRRSQQAPELNQFLGALYGARRVSTTSAGAADSVRVCLYFADSDFFKYRCGRLDGALVLDNGRGELWLNDHGDRLARLRESGLARAFAERDALRDAGILERRNAFLVADCAVDRKDERAVCRYLERKYNLRRVGRMHSLGFEGIEFVPLGP